MKTNLHVLLFAFAAVLTSCTPSTSRWIVKPDEKATTTIFVGPDVAEEKVLNELSDWIGAEDASPGAVTKKTGQCIYETEQVGDQTCEVQTMKCFYLTDRSDLRARGDKLRSEVCAMRVIGKDAMVIDLYFPKITKLWMNERFRSLHKALAHEFGEEKVRFARITQP